MDLREAINHIYTTHPSTPIYAVGYSLGSNILVKYLGEEGIKTPIVSAISVGNPYDFYKSSKALSKFYSYILSRGLIAYYKRHKNILNLNPKIKQKEKQIIGVRALRDFDDLVTRVFFSYQSVDDYYRDASCINVINSM